VLQARTNEPELDLASIVEVTIKTDDGQTISVELESWDENGMQFKLGFDDPLAVSGGINPDSISINIKDKSMFKDEFD
jgi:hypothetical protein